MAVSAGALLFLANQKVSLDLSGLIAEVDSC